MTRKFRPEDDSGVNNMYDLRQITIDELMDRYDVLLLDAYGVLVHSTGVLAGAARLIEKLEQASKPYYIVTNDASRLPATAAARFQGLGLPIEAGRIITSGALLEDYFDRHRLAGSRCVVLGPRDSERYVELAGGGVVSPSDAFDVLIVADESGFPFLETVDTVLTALIRRFDRGEHVHLLLPNPDLIYPKSGPRPGSGTDSEPGFGITSGSIALVIEAALHQRYPGRGGLSFEKLGKPHTAIFEEALRRSGTRNMVMIGDQLATDIRGANAFGLDSVLVRSGVTHAEAIPADGEMRPTFILKPIG